MNIILLSGGSGKRLWPLSNDIRSKQFIKIFKKKDPDSAANDRNAADGGYESMVQRVYRQIKAVDADATVTIATSKTQVSAIHNQLGEDIGISVEPCRRDTFPAIALATAYLHDVQGVPLDEVVVVCPVDPYVEDDYFAALKGLAEQAAKGEANLVLMGIEPTYPSEKYGYIIPKPDQSEEEAGAVQSCTMQTFDRKTDITIAQCAGEKDDAEVTQNTGKTLSGSKVTDEHITRPGDAGLDEHIMQPSDTEPDDNSMHLGGTGIDERTMKISVPEKNSEITPNPPVSWVETFREKPDAETAKAYIAQGALWNGGVFAYKLQYVLEQAHQRIDFTDYADLFDKYETLPKISFDYAVAEKEPKIQVMRFAGSWKDLGTWNTLTEAMSEPTIGEAILNDACENVNVINELNVPVVCMGLQDVIVSASPEGILVSDKEQSSYIKPIVDQITQQIMFAEKSWGSFRVIDVDEGSLTIKVTLNPGHSMNYHSHQRRDEIWNVISGEGTVVVDGMEQPVKAGDVVTMQAGCRHTVFAVTELKMIEVQLGEEISVHDKQKFDFDI